MNTDYHRSNSAPAPAPVELPMDGVLDLHAFRPRDIGALVPDWLAACQERGLLELRIIHGKGVGNLQRSVHAVLSQHPEVGVAPVSLRSGKNRSPAGFRRLDVAGRATPASQPQPAAAMAC